MIKSFKYKGLEDFFYEGRTKGIQARHADRLKRILSRLDALESVMDLAFPGSDLHLLEPKSVGKWAVKVSGSWRITFHFVDGNALYVDYVNYH